MLLFFMGCGSVKNINKDKAGIKSAYFQWVHEVESAHGYTQKVVDLYADDAILLPTLSSKMCTTKHMLSNYFSYFLNLPNLQVETKQLITRRYGDIGMNTGFYNVSYMNGSKKESLHGKVKNTKRM